MTLARAFATVGGFTMTSRVLGLVREIMIAALLGAGPVAEAFFVAFRFPNLFRRFFAEGAFNMAFVPLFAKRLEGPNGAEEAKGFAEEALAGLLGVLLILTVAAQLAMPWAILGIAFGFAAEPSKLALAEAFAAIQFPYLLFVSLAALYSGVLNSLGRFAAAAGAPILLNVVMIVALVVVSRFAPGDAAALGYALSWSVFAAGVAQLWLVARASARAGVSLRLRRPRWTPAMRRLLVLGAPGAVAGGVTQLNILIGTTIATFFSGAVAWLSYADRLYQLPLGVIGVAIGVALLPDLSRRLRAGDAAGARQSATTAVAISLGLATPAAVALIVAAHPIVDAIFGRGAFTETDVEATALATAIFAAGLPAYVLNKCLSPAYFAEEDTRTPLRFAVWSMALNTAISAGAAPVIGWLAIPIGTAAAAWLNVALLWRGLGDRPAQPDAARLGRRGIGVAAASLGMGAALIAAQVAFAPAFADPLWRYPALGALVLGGVAVYAAAALAFGGLTRDDLRRLRRRGAAPAATAGPA